MGRYFRYIITALLLIGVGLSLYFFEYRQNMIVQDPATNFLLKNIITRLALTALFVWMLYSRGDIEFLFFRGTFLRDLIWCIPCFLVALANFPYSALFNGTLQIVRMDLLALYVLYVTAIALLEEFVFRGLAVSLLYGYFRNKPFPCLMTTIVVSAFFSLTHLANLFYGASIGSVLLQIGYSFLIGAMLTVVMFKTRNIWICVIVHALFNFGGLLTESIAVGGPWDLVFWIVTAACGILCATHIIIALVKLERD